MKQDMQEFECPYCKETFYMKRGGFSNHMRYCKYNPNVNINRKNNKLMGQKMHLNYINSKNEYTFICEHCGKEYKLKLTEDEFNKKKYTKFCSRSCANARHHSLETKQKISKSIKQYYPEQKRYCIVCGEEITNRSIKYCSSGCKKKYRLLQKINTEILNLNNEQKILEIRKIYRKYCQFSFNLSSYKDEFDFELIKQFGWYTAKNHGNNLNGVSRDHKYSCNEGFINLVDPYIISHPANCELIQQSKNASKYFKCSITIEQLIENIKKWNEKYGEFENKIDYDVFGILGIEFKYKI